MIKFIKLSAAVAGTVLLLAACTKNEPAVVNDNNVISFKTVVGKMGTKAMIDGTAYKTTDPSFGTAAYHLAKDNTWATNSATATVYITRREVSWQTVTGVAGVTEAWTTDIAYYWPIDGGSLTFFSYSPWADENGTTVPATISKENGVVLTDWDVDANQTVDFMVADVAKDQTSNTTAYTEGSASYNGVPTVFRHKLSQIVAFTVKTDVDYTNGNTFENRTAADMYVSLNSIAIEGVNYTGTYTSGNNVNDTNIGEWEPTTDTKNYTWFTNDAAPDGTNPTLIGLTTTELNGDYDENSSYGDILDGVITNGYLLVLPQKFTEGGSAKIVVNYTVYNNGVSVPKEAKIDLYEIQNAYENSWKMNKKITYNLIISLEQQRILWSPSVVDWEDESHDITLNQ